MSIEKRRYFRITDTLGLSFRIIKPGETESRVSSTSVDGNEILEKLNSDLEILLNSLWSKDPVLAKSISLLSQKIEMVSGISKANGSSFEGRFVHQFPKIEVNISASGMAFTSDVKIKTHDRIELLLILSPSKSRLSLKGTVVNVDENDVDGEKSFFTCVDFDIDVQKREQLIQHIVQRQVESIVNRAP